MRKINEKDYVSFTIYIKKSGCKITFHTFRNALIEWAGISTGTLYGNKPDGTKAIIDSK